jgi:flavin reductase (DIM6/NTAB) family NADH-FMN oxidoreductase RutF
MFWKTDEPHTFRHNPFKSCIVPRPIGWISTVDENGVPNLAPYSFFNGVASEPPMVMFANNGPRVKGEGAKDTVTNCEKTGEFVFNMATHDLRDAMNASTAMVGPEVDEFDLAGLEKEPAQLVKPSRVKASPIHMECVYHSTVDLPCDVPGTRNAVVFGRVVGINIADAFLKDGIVDIEAIRPIARMGYMDYSTVEKVWSMQRPG